MVLDVNNINNLGVIYKITNKKSGKSYVGQTTQKLKDRLGQHRTDSRPYPISLAIRKYGWENFEVAVLATSASRQTLDLLEEFFIIENNTQKPFGYNLKAGGNNSVCTEDLRERRRKIQLGKKHSPETRQKMSLARRGKSKHWASMMGRKHSEKTKQILSEQKTGKKNPFFGRKHTDETKARISAWSSKPRKHKALQSSQE